MLESQRKELWRSKDSPRVHTSLTKDKEEAKTEIIIKITEEEVTKVNKENKEIEMDNQEINLIETLKDLNKEKKHNLTH